jgi:hypothetical protein
MENVQEQPLTPTTTTQEDLVVAGQRKVNLIWEFTQAGVALLITGALIYCEINNIDSATIRNGFFLIIGFYFSRTNHQAIGGIGAKKNEGQAYQGR